MIKTESTTEKHAEMFIELLFMAICICCLVHAFGICGTVGLMMLTGEQTSELKKLIKSKTYEPNKLP